VIIQLTPEQADIIAANGTEPIHVRNPKTNAEYVLVSVETYHRSQPPADDDADALTALLVDLDPEDWEDASVYEGKP
jgi:hypothetical protein